MEKSEPGWSAPAQCDTLNPIAAADQSILLHCVSLWSNSSVTPKERGENDDLRKVFSKSEC